MMFRLNAVQEQQLHPAAVPGSDSTDMTGSIAFVTCIEAGGLEQQVVRMIKSLRKWGGRFANAPVYAVKPRPGVPLSRATLAGLDECEATFRSIRPVNPYRWYAFMNKPLSLIEAEAQSTAD